MAVCLYVQVPMCAMQEYMSICACLYMCTSGLHRCVGEQCVHVFCMCAGMVLCSCVVVTGPCTWLVQPCILFCEWKYSEEVFL